MLFEDIEVAEILADKIFDSIIDQIVFGPEITEDQIRYIYCCIAKKATEFSKEE